MKSNTRIMTLDRRVSAAVALAAAAALVLLLFTGCTENPSFRGQDIKFQAGANPATKTAYGDIIGETGNRTQRVDWKSDDLIRISCAAVSEPSAKYADYKVTSVLSPVTGDASSKAKISLSGNGSTIGLRWGSSSADHTFFGIYPSPATDGKSADSIDKDGKVSGNIPALQAYKAINSAAPYVAQPDMTNQYMVAKTTKPAGSQTIGDDEVFLWFTPITTAIEFTIKNNFADASSLDIKGISVISESHNLSGSFSTDLSAWTGTGSYPAVTAATGATKTASIAFAPLSLAKDEELTFTMFFLPEEDLDDLTLKIVKTDDTWLSAKIARSETEAITFDRCKKHFLKGILVEDGALWVDFSAKVQSWKTGVSQAVDVYDQNTYVFEINGSEALQYLRFQNGAEAESQNLQITSYSYNPSDPTNKTAVSFSAYYSTNGGRSYLFFNAPSEAAASNGLWGMKSTNNAGSTTAKTYPITAVARELVNPGSHDYWVNGGTNESWSPKDWTSKGTIYLPFYNLSNDSVDRTFSSGSSANCYIIRHSGSYVLPVIYGNAMSKNYYKPKSMNFYSKESNSLQKAVNYLGREITSPFINKDDGVSVAGCKILWQDVAGVITDVQYYDDIRNCVPNTASWNGKYVGSNLMAGLAFTVDPEKICQCNAVIGIVDADDNVIWSWHIWVTNDPAILKAPKSVYSSNEVEYKVFPMPALGTVSLSIYPGRPDLILRLKQNGSGIERLIAIYQVDRRESQRAAYYQFGRKDPFCAGVMTVSPSPATDITEGIKHPNVFYSGSNWLSDDHRYINLWSGAYAAPGSGVDQQLTMHKTIYDPSPAGYMVPALNAFSTLSSYIGEFNLGYFFKLTGDDLDGTYFGTMGYLSGSGVLQESGTAGKYWSIIPDSLTSGGVLTIGSGAASPAALETGIPLGYGCLVRPVTDPNAKEL